MSRSCRALVPEILRQMRRLGVASQRSFALNASVSASTVTRMLHGQPVEIEHLRAVARHCKVPVDSLINHDDAKVELYPSRDMCDDLLDAGLELFGEAFTDPRWWTEPEDIRYWVEAAKAAERFPELAGRNRHLFGVLYDETGVGGCAWITACKGERLCFGDYFAMKPNWQSGGTPCGDNKLLRAMWERVLVAAPRTIGMVVEVEPFRLDVLRRASEMSSFKGLSTKEHDEIVKEYRNAMRIRYFQTLHGYTVVDGHNAPFEYTVPALKEPLGPDMESQCFLMVRLNDGKRPDVTVDAVLRFVYEDLYKEEYCAPGEKQIPGYGKYVGGVMRRMLAKAKKENCRLGTMRLPPEVAKVHSIFRDDDFEVSLR